MRHSRHAAPVETGPGGHAPLSRCTVLQEDARATACPVRCLTSTAPTHLHARTRKEVEHFSRCWGYDNPDRWLRTADLRRRHTTGGEKDLKFS